MQNQIEYKEGYTPNTLDDTENSFVFGKGWSYGAEILVNKVRGRLTGWVGYTLSWTWRKFPDLNFGDKYPAKYDRRHDLSVVAIYELNKKWKLHTLCMAAAMRPHFPSVFILSTGVVAGIQPNQPIPAARISQARCKRGSDAKEK